MMLHFSLNWKNLDQINYDHIVTVENMRAILGYNLSKNRANYVKKAMSKAVNSGVALAVQEESAPKKGKEKTKTGVADKGKGTTKLSVADKVKGKITEASERGRKGQRDAPQLGSKLMGDAIRGGARVTRGPSPRVETVAHKRPKTHEEQGGLR
jgi:hypothetical protein